MRDKDGFLVGSKWANGAPGAKPVPRNAELETARKRKESLEDTIQILQESGIKVDPKLKEELEKHKQKLSLKISGEASQEEEKKARISKLVARRKTIARIIENYQELGDLAIPEELQAEKGSIEVELKTLTQKPAEERIKSLQDKKSHLEKALEGKKTMVQKRREELEAMEQSLQEETQKMEQIQSELAQAYKELHPPSTGEEDGPQPEQETPQPSERDNGGDNMDLGEEAEEGRAEKRREDRGEGDSLPSKKKKSSDES